MVYKLYLNKDGGGEVSHVTKNFYSKYGHFHTQSWEYRLVQLILTVRENLRLFKKKLSIKTVETVYMAYPLSAQPQKSSHMEISPKQNPEGRQTSAAPPETKREAQGQAASKSHIHSYLEYMVPDRGATKVNVKVCIAIPHTHEAILLHIGPFKYTLLWPQVLHP